MMIGRANTRDLLERALSLSCAAETEVVLLGIDEQLTRFASNTIHQHVAEANRYIVVRAALGNRVGVSASNDLTREGLERVVSGAVAAARLRPDDPDFPGLPEPADVAPVTSFDDETASCSPAERARHVGVVCRRASEAGTNAAGAFRTAIHEWAVANSHGLFAYHAATEADVTVVAMAEDEGSGFSTDASWRVGEISVEACGDEAIAGALRSRSPQRLAPGVYPVVLGPYAAHDVVQTLGSGAGAIAVQEGRSWMSGRRGERLMSPLISIWDDGRDLDGWPVPIDFEGVPRQRVDIVRQGVVGDVTYDRARAAKDNTASTGHALPAANPFSPWLNAARVGPISLHTFLGAGRSSMEEMIAGTQRGLYVTRFWYTRTVHPRDAVITGMTRDGTFLIEGGELTRPVRNLRFTQSYVDALEATEAVGRQVRRVWSEPGIISAPALKLSAFTFTS
jgi:predicted Zn-dependent protease